MNQRVGQGADPEVAQRFHTLVELAPDGILIHDGESVVFANAAALRLAGASSRDDLVGRPIRDLLAPPYLRAVQDQLTTPELPADQAAPVQDTLRRLDGSEVPVEVRAVAFLEHDRPAAHVVLRDISGRLAAARERRQAEALLQEAQRREALGVLAGGMAHEINNMMSVVLGFSECLLEDPRVPRELHDDLREIMKAGDHTVDITQRLLEFSSCAAHRPRLVDLGDVVSRAEPVIRRLVGGGRRFVQVTDATPPVWADPLQLEQVAINLVLNACDAMPDGGTLTLTLAESELPSGLAAPDEHPQPDARYATLVVSDTGVGMDTATRTRIFDPFFTTKPTRRGTGLGLSAVEGLVRQNHGYISVASAPGEGAAFTVYLPVYPLADVVDE
jgi:PAS domain S-box-containing protein